MVTTLGRPRDAVVCLPLEVPVGADLVLVEARASVPSGRLMVARVAVRMPERGGLRSVLPMLVYLPAAVELPPVGSVVELLGARVELVDVSGDDGDRAAALVRADGVREVRSDVAA